MALSPEEIRRLLEQQAGIAPGTTTPQSTAPGQTTPQSTAPGTTTPQSVAPPTTPPGLVSPPPAITTPASRPPPTTAPGVSSATTPPSAPTPPGSHTTPLSNAALPITQPSVPRRDTATAKTFEELLAILRQERADWDAANAQGDAEARAQWQDFVEHTLASQRTPDEKALEFGDSLLDDTQDDLRDIIGRLPWVRDTLMGTVLSVDRATKTCRVRVGTDAQNPTAVPFQRKVSYGAKAPVVGRTYPVHFPVVVPRSPQPITAGPQTDPEHLPWLKVPGRQSPWLYYLQTGLGMGLWRTKLDDPAETPNDGEFCSYMPQPFQNWNGPLMYHTGTRTIFLQSSRPADGETSQTDVGGLADLSTELYKADDWGFNGADTLGTEFHPVCACVDDTLATDPSGVVLGAFRPIPTTVHETGDVIDIVFDAWYHANILASTDGGGTYSTLDTMEYYKDNGAVIVFPGPPSYIVNNPWCDGQTRLYGASGFVNASDNVFGSAGDRILPIPISTVIAPPPADYHSLTDLHYWNADQNAYGVISFGVNLFDAGKCWIGQDAEGLYTVISDGVPCMRGRGPIEALLWSPLIVPKVISVSPDGAAILAWLDSPIGVDEPDEVARVGFSLDYGDTWEELPAAWWATGGDGPVITPFLSATALLVNIPDTDPRAVRGAA